MGRKGDICVYVRDIMDYMKCVCIADDTVI